MGRVDVLNMLPKGGIGCEVGVWKGGYSAKLLKATNPTRLHLVDPWQYNPDLPSAWYGRIGSQLEMDRIHASVVRRFCNDSRVAVHRMTSNEAARHLPTLDWVYIDGDHRYQGCRADLVNYLRLLRPGGILAGDDYGNHGWWGEGVRDAVHEVLGDDFTVSGTQYIHVKHGKAQVQPR